MGAFAGHDIATFLAGDEFGRGEKTKFFAWFHLEQTGRETDPEKRPVVIFKPSGDVFHKLVTVRSALDSREQIVRIDLLLARTFINDKEQGVFANDIAKSFLLDATSGADKEAIRSLADDIYPHQASGERVITARPRPAYLTYLGRQPLDTDQLSRSTLHLENLMLGDQGWLQIALSFRK